MKQTFPWALKARVSGVMHRVWKRWEGLMLCRARAHSAHTAHTSSSVRQLSLRERMSARDTFSCGHIQVCFRFTLEFSLKIISKGVPSVHNRCRTSTYSSKQVGRTASYKLQLKSSQKHILGECHCSTLFIKLNAKFTTGLEEAYVS